MGVVSGEIVSDPIYCIYWDGSTKVLSPHAIDRIRR
jgi:hypothetical protein